MIHFSIISMFQTRQTKENTSHAYLSKTISILSSDCHVRLRSIKDVIYERFLPLIRLIGARLR